MDEVERREFAGKKAKLAAAELAKLSRRVCGECFNILYLKDNETLIIFADNFVEAKRIKESFTLEYSEILIVPKIYKHKREEVLTNMLKVILKAELQ